MHYIGDMRKAAVLTAQDRRRREQVRFAAVEQFEQRAPVADIAAEPRVSERSVQR
jgi:hypothetical protein